MNKLNKFFDKVKSKFFWLKSRVMRMAAVWVPGFVAALEFARDNLTALQQALAPYSYLIVGSLVSGLLIWSRTITTKPLDDHKDEEK